MAEITPETREAGRVALEVLGMKVLGLPLPDEVIDAVAETDPDDIIAQMAVCAAHFARHLADRAGLDLIAEWATWSTLADAAYGPSDG